MLGGLHFCSSLHPQSFPRQTPTCGVFCFSFALCFSLCVCVFFNVEIFLGTWGRNGWRSHPLSFLEIARSPALGNSQNQTLPAIPPSVFLRHLPEPGAASWPVSGRILRAQRQLSRSAEEVVPSPTTPPLPHSRTSLRGRL